MPARLEEIFGNLEIDSTTTGAIEERAYEAFTIETPIEFAWFERRQREPMKTADVAVAFLNANFQEPAWALSQLYYDQSLKQSVAEKKRGNLAWPAMGLAAVAGQIGHTAALRHYSAIALAGDVIQENETYRGAAIHALRARWGRREVDKFIKWCRDCSGQWKSDRPIYPEALLVAYWFKSRRKCILDLAEAKRGAPFVEVLLDAAEKETDRGAAGTLFEAAVALILSATPGFEVRGSTKDVSSQTDLLVVTRNDSFTGALLPEGYAIAECKFQVKAVKANTVREFGARCLLANVQLGILAARKGITGAGLSKSALRDAERERGRLLGRGVHVLVLSAADLRGRAREMRGVQDTLVDDFERVRFGRRT